MEKKVTMTMVGMRDKDMREEMDMYTPDKGMEEMGPQDKKVRNKNILFGTTCTKTCFIVFKMIARGDPWKLWQNLHTLVLFGVKNNCTV